MKQRKITTCVSRRLGGIANTQHTNANREHLFSDRAAALTFSDICRIFTVAVAGMLHRFFGWIHLQHTRILIAFLTRTLLQINACLPFTMIYTGKPVGLPFGSVWANGEQISVLGKFRSGLVLTICRNLSHLRKH